MKKFLLATAAVLASTSAYAADYGVDHPFYTPAQGKFVSTTEYNYTHAFRRNKDGQTPKTAAFEREFSETLKYGVTNDIQVGLSLSRSKVEGKEWEDGVDWFDDSRSHTHGWELSAGYNVINDGKAFLNVGLVYSQEAEREKLDVVANPFDIQKDENSKAVRLEVSGGYNLDVATVFGAFSYERQIDGEKQIIIPWGGAVQFDKSRSYVLEAGVFKAFNDQISARTSLSVEADETKGEKQRTYWWNVGAAYSFNKDMSVGLNASYLLEDDLRGQRFDGIDYVSRRNEELHSTYKVGIDFTIAF